MNTNFCDILVIGSGIAGLSAAIELSQNYNVFLVTKSKLRSGSTWYAQGGIAAATSSKESIEKHFQDTIRAGGNFSKVEAVRLIVENGPKIIDYLNKLGIRFDRESGKISLATEGGHSVPRIYHVKDRTGSALEKALAKKATSTGMNLKIIENVFISELIIDGNKKCIGAKALKNNIELFYLSKLTILASGGACQIYRNTTNPDTCTGDGVASAYIAGAMVSDMEFVQFHPTGVINVEGPKSLISESVRGEGAYLRDKGLNRFMVNEHPLAELAPRDVVSRSIEKTMKNQGTDHVYFDARHLGKDALRNRFPNIYKNLLEIGYDLASDLIPVAPVAHYIIGGIVADLYGRTSIPGLFSCGEASLTGAHGANRLGSNSLLEGVVYSKIISSYINVLNMERISLPSIDKLTSYISSGKVTKKNIQNRVSNDFRSKIKETSTNNLSVLRNKNKLKESIKIFDDILKILSKTEICDICLYEIFNLATIAKLVAVGALTREESRGTHFREDFPTINDEWENKHTVQIHGGSRNNINILSWEKIDDLIQKKWEVFTHDD